MTNYVTVKDLIKLLQEVENKDRIIIMSEDVEGNGYSPFDTFDTSSYKAGCTWSGDIGIEELTDELKNEGFESEDVLDGEPALVFYPIN